MRRLTLVSLLLVSAACARDAVPKPAAAPSYLYVWAGDSAKTASDYLALINSDPTSPKLLTAFGDRSGFSHPHTFIRLANVNVLATF